MVRVKICGITQVDDALLASSAGADAVGFVFAESPRRVSAETGARIIAELPPFVTKVGLFVDETIARVATIFETCGLDALQFHGDETPEYCAEFCGRARVIKAFRMKDRHVLEDLRGYARVDAFLLDSFSPAAKGGTGERFDWSLAIEAKKCGKPVVLAGGLTVENVEEAVKTVRPYAVDVSSGVESKPGIKDPALLKEFIVRAKGVDC